MSPETNLFGSRHIFAETLYGALSQPFVLLACLTSTGSVWFLERAGIPFLFKALGSHGSCLVPRSGCPLLALGYSNRQR
jgi:hypothetical protein